MLVTKERALATGLALVAVAICAAAAAAATTTKDFSATITPSSVPAGRLVDMTATIRNLTAQQRLGSANVTPPPGFAALSVTSLSRPQPATATIVGGVVQLRELSLSPQDSVTVALKVMTPCSVGVWPDWTVVAKQANDFSGSPGNSLTLDPGASSLSATTIGACTPCPEDQGCSASLDGPTGSQSTVTSDPDATKVDVGLLTMSQTDAHDCAGYAERSSDAFLMDAPQNRAKRAVLTFSSATRPVTGRDPLEVCYASPWSFAPKAKTALSTVVIEGVLHYVGRLPDCVGRTAPPCVTNRDNALRSIEFEMPPGDPRYM
jgi:hypothetical protein